MSAAPETIIIGAGWAGLACAYELVKKGHSVLILEAAPQIGGRARAVNFQNYTLDNGQHIAIGAYTVLRELLQELNLAEASLFKILPMELITVGSKRHSFKLARLPKPWNFIIGLLFKSKMAWASKWQLVTFFFKCKQQKFRLVNDCSILDLLKNYHQSESVIEHFWKPIALAIMSTPIHQASAQVFLNVLQLTFARNNSANNWYFPSVDLTAVLPQHFVTYLEQKSVNIIYKQNIQQIEFTNDGCIAISNSSQKWHAKNLVLAVPPWQAKNLLQPHNILEDTYKALDRFNFEAITTLYFIYDQPIQLPYPMLGILNATTQWIFDRVFVAQPNILSVVITGNLAAQFDSQQQIKNQVLQEICKHFPRLANPSDCKIINEKRAAFSCDVAIQQHRPIAATALNNLWLTGDYLQTGLPATLEGALVSGRETARSLLSISPRSNQNC